MPICGACGRESPEGFGFCPGCGAPLVEPEPERRKLVTLLFCDVSGSTAMGERVDAESVRELMFRYFHSMRDAIERHGGTVEKFIGDAVMAAFGVPVSHEDDALRAVRAAAEMQHRVVDLNEELRRRVGTTIALRIGVHTGEVVAGDAALDRETFVTGDAVNTAARLEQAASPGEVLIGQPTLRLVRDAVEVEAIEPLSAKGKAEPLPAYRLIRVHALAPGRARRFGGVLVGRRSELTLLEDVLEDVANGACRLASVVGEAGVGKSRLVQEIVREADALVLEGRCLAYGDGITYWALAEIVRAAAAIHDETTADEAQRRVVRLAGDPAVASPLALALGIGEGTASPETIAWATARMLEQLAAARTVMVVIDDLHWAEDALLDLLEYVALRSEGRIMLLALARPELLERRPGWPGTVVRLEPLAGSEVDALTAELDVPETDRDRIRAASGGNPLFVEELAAMLVEDPDASIPATLEELLGARLDRLDRAERDAAERGSIEGQLFHRSAVEALSDEVTGVRPAIERLSERELCTPAEAAFVDDAAFRFRHILIRDAAYRSTAKRLRAALHERFADWLLDKAGARLPEVEEIVGFHLEQSGQLLAELGPVDREDLRSRASEHLAAAGIRALDRGDLAAGVNLLQRARAATADPGRQAELSIEVAIGLMKLGRFPEAEGVVDDALREATTCDDERLRLAAGVESAFLRTVHNVASGDELSRVTARAAERLSELGASLECARALTRACIGHVFEQRLERAGEVGRQAFEHALEAGRQREQAEILEWVSLAHAYGPEPIDREEPIVRELDQRSADDRSVEWFALLHRAISHAYRGEFGQARELVGRSLLITSELGLAFNHACTSMQATLVELLAGDPGAAERALRGGLEELEALNAENPLASVEAWLALVLGQQGEAEEALRCVERVERVANHDLEPRVLAGAARARALASRGALADAEAAARGALALWEGRDNVVLGAQALQALADVLQRRGETEQARAVLERELAMHERKRNLPGADRARRELAAL